MYHYIENEELIKAMKNKYSNIMGQLVKTINDDIYLEVKYSLIGSGKRNLITQNGNSPVDLDYNLTITAWNSEEIDILDGQSVKEYIRNCFNLVLRKHNMKDCNDSKSSLTTKKEDLTGFDIKASIDLCIIFENEEDYYRLVHKKTGDTSKDEWVWNQGRDFSIVKERELWIKENNLWNQVRETYLRKKNMYLTRGDKNHPSYVCYIETINEVYNKN